MKGDIMIKEYMQLDRIEGPLIVLSGVENAAYDEIVEIKTQDGIKHGKVVQLYKDKAIIQVFEPTSGLSVKDVSVRFTGKPLEISLSKEILGRIFSGHRIYWSSINVKTFTAKYWASTISRLSNTIKYST
jgi:V/A-type H+-transporting ATPase subunit B